MPHLIFAHRNCGEQSVAQNISGQKWIHEHFQRCPVVKIEQSAYMLERFSLARVLVLHRARFGIIVEVPSV